MTTMNKIGVGLFNSKKKLNVISIFCLILFCSVNLFADKFDVKDINGIELRLGKKFSQYYINNSVLVFFAKNVDDSVKLQGALLKLISVSNSVVKSATGISQYKQPVEIVFAHKEDNEKNAADVQIRILDKHVIRVLISDDIQALKDPVIRKKILDVFLLAKFGYLKNKKYLNYVPDWISTALEKSQRFYYDEKIHRDKDGLVKKPKIFRTFPAMSALVHSRGRLEISQIVDFPVPNEKFKAIYEAYSEACFQLLETLTKPAHMKNRQLIKKIVYHSLKGKQPISSNYIYQELISEVKKSNRKASVVSRARQVNYFSPLKINQLIKQEEIANLDKLSFEKQKKYIDEWFFNQLKKQFLSYYEPYRYYEMKDAIKDLCNVEVEVFNSKTPITSDIILEKSTIKLEKLLYNLDKINNITIVLDDLITEVLKLKFKSSFIYQESFDKFLKKLQLLQEEKNYEQFGADKFRNLVMTFKKDVAKISIKAKKLDDMLSNVEDNKIPPWYLYYFEFYSQDFFDAVNRESAATKKLLDEVEKEFNLNDVKSKKKTPKIKIGENEKLL